MPDYTVGTIITPSGVTDALFQAGNATMAADEYEAKDVNGNTVDRKSINHRITIHSEFIVAAGSPIPTPGATVTITGVNAPTVSADGAVTGTFSTGGTSTISARVTGDVTVSSSNSDYVQGSFDAVHDLVNNLP